MKIRKSLRLRVLGLLIPLMVFGMGLTGYLLKQNWVEIRQGHQLLEGTRYVQNVSHWIHELQKERGMSAGFLSGTVPQEALNQERAKVSTLGEQLKPFLEGKEPVKWFSELDRMRKSVDQGIQVSEVIAGYSGLVSELIQSQAELARQSPFHGLEGRLISQSIFEVAKENTGILRALGTGILAKDKAISIEEALRIQSHQTAIMANLKSPGLIISQESREQVSKVLESDDWKSSLLAQSVIYQKHDVGGYGFDPKKFFEVNTKVIDQVNEILNREADLVFTQVENQIGILNRGLAVLLGVLILGLGASIAITMKLVGEIVSKVSGMASDLTELGSRKISIVVGELSIAAHDLSLASQKQAGSLQTTSSAVDEISAMVRKTSELAQETNRLSVDSKDKALQGNLKVEEMKSMMIELQKQNDRLSQQMLENNNVTSGMLSMIQEVGSKTRVINDIVFQTKLLSFNASVEAARAGEHGKGFAVVAEEVGNLAQSSGNAAREINQLLETSLKQVEEMAKTSTDRMDSMVKTTQSMMAQGTRVAQECSQILLEIVDSSQSVMSQVEHINQASGECSKGVEDISRELISLNDSSLPIVDAAKNCNRFSEQLSHQMTELKEVSSGLSTLATGEVPLTRFEFKDEYLLQVKAMDDEHKVLVDRINGLANALDRNPENIMTAFTALVETTLGHFKDEEAYMMSIGYPDVEAHKKIHQNLVQKVTAFGEQIKAGTANRFEIMDFLNGWLLKHILGVDMKYAHFSRNGGSNHNNKKITLVTQRKVA